jgi:Protein of unknown function (DUF2817)
MAADSPFAQTYAEARGKFGAAADAAGLDVHNHIHPMLGRDGETLALDVALQGRRDAAKLLIVSSGCHGVEGFCGSAVQVDLLRDAAWRRAVHDSGVAVLYLHALNPYGFSWWRRTTHENVDLNRNFHDFSLPLPANPGYDELAALLVPEQWPPTPAVQSRVGRFVAERGLAALQQAVSGGQYDHPEGLFYGGRDPTWSNVTLRHVLREQCAGCARLGWIDVHSGLGPNGHAERICASGDDDAAALQRARVWWGDAVTAIHDGGSASAPLTGLMWQAVGDECPQAETTGIALEVGTVPILALIDALRADQWLENHPEAPEAQRVAIKRQLRDAFYTDTDDWKQRVLEQAREAALQALGGLARG